MAQAWIGWACGMGHVAGAAHPSAGSSELWERGGWWRELGYGKDIGSKLVSLFLFPNAIIYSMNATNNFVYFNYQESLNVFTKFKN
jgi:hypothetical protein